tara:strand:+ start:1079 stop:1252 length:174 start_codon:yes stop_codon:yes gene_type:complete
MNIENCQYITDINNKNSMIKATINSVIVFVPLEPANRHYDAIQEWIKIDGNSIADAD